MSPAIDTLYPFLTPKERDELLDLFEKHYSIASLADGISQIKGVQVSDQAIQEALVISYLDEGDSLKAEQLTREFLRQHPNAHTHNLLLRCLLSSPREIQQEYYDESISWSKRYETPDSVAATNCVTNESLTIGLFCNYADTVFGDMAIFPMLENFAANGIHTILYNFSLSKLNVHRMANTVQAHLEIRNVKDLTRVQLQHLISEDNIEILFDLNGRLREDNRLTLFFNKPAAIQINYFNLVGTTGMNCFDYIIADNITLPESEERYYTEKVIRLPCGVNGAYRMLRTTPVKAPPFQQNGFITFGSFNAFFKFNEPLLIFWSNILKAVPKSRIIIKNQEVSRQRVRKKILSVFAANGIHKDRVTLEGFTPMEIMKARYAAVDIALDTFPYSGGSTTLNALWQGVPTITLQGQGWRSNTAASMLASAKMDDLITRSEDEYLDKAVELAAQFSLLKNIREQLKNTINECPYFRPDIVYPELALALQKIRPSRESDGAALKKSRSAKQ